jgi:hypothetical protein
MTPEMTPKKNCTEEVTPKMRHFAPNCAKICANRPAVHVTKVFDGWLLKRNR